MRLYIVISCLPCTCVSLVGLLSEGLKCRGTLGPASNENRDLQHQQHQQAAGQSARLAARGEARRGLPSGAEGDGFGIPDSGDREGRLRRGLARAEIVERRRHSCPRLRAGRHAHRAARRSGRYAKPLHRGGGERRADRHALCAERQSAAGTEIRIQARVDEALIAHAAELYALERRSCWPATTTSCRPMPTSIRRNPTRTMRSCSPSLARCSARLLDQGWIDAIRTLHPDAPMYTFWDYMRNRWQRDAGLRSIICC